MPFGRNFSKCLGGCQEVAFEGRKRNTWWRCSSLFGRKQEWLDSKVGRYGMSSEWKTVQRNRDSVSRTWRISQFEFGGEMCTSAHIFIDSINFFLASNRAGPRHICGRCDCQHERMPRICSRCRTSYFQGLY